VLKGLVLACAGFALFQIIHVPLFRLQVSEFRFRTMVRIAFALGILLLVVYLATPPALGGFYESGLGD